jgi:hypothetical protein
MHWAQRRHPQRLPATYTRHHGVRHLLAFFDVTVIDSGDTSFSASVGKRLFVPSNAYENIILAEYESISFWTTFHLTSVQRYDAGHEKTMFAWFGPRPMLLGSIGSNASSLKSGSSASTTLSIHRIVSFSALCEGSSVTATSDSVTRPKRNHNINL